jgi:polyphosphate kinase
MYAYLSTGNFNEKTARVYCDHGLLTADPRITQEVLDVFAFLSSESGPPEPKHLLVAPFTLRDSLDRLLGREVENARNGLSSGAFLKMNGLGDRKMIDRLFGAGRSGLKLDLLVRGICRLKPGVPGLSENIRAHSIVDRFLEHARVFRFENGGEPVLFLSSADLMKRNLDRRIEVTFPIYDPEIKAELEQILRFQRADNSKARILDANQENRYATRPAGAEPIEAQRDCYSWLQSRIPDPHLTSPQGSPRKL